MPRRLDASAIIALFTFCMSRARPRFSDPFRRVLASGCAGLVLALTFFAASPAAHKWLHAAAHDDHTCAKHPAPAPVDSDHACAVVLFANGVDTPVEPLALSAPVPIAEGLFRIAAEDIFLVSPRYLRQPERGPPVSWVS